MKLNLEKGSKRKFILIEIKEDTVDEVIIPRLKALVLGNDKGNIKPHGGGFRYYKLLRMNKGESQ